jgi:tRNA threonylcarbamoyladenosine biosynthesis protein TsaE
MNKEIWVCSPDELEKVVSEMLGSGNSIFIISGPLGAGKTTLVQKFARRIGWEGEVTSPTFTIQNLYSSSPPVYHYDLYRVEADKFIGLGLLYQLGEKGFHLLEWGEKIEPILKSLGIPFGKVEFEVVGEKRRVVCRF